MGINFLPRNYGYADGSKFMLQPGIANNGTLVSLATNGKADEVTFNAGSFRNSPTILYGAKEDKITLSGNWREDDRTKGKDEIKDNVTGFYGRIYTNDAGDQLMVSGTTPIINGENNNQPQNNNSQKISQTDLKADVSAIEAYSPQNGTPDGTLDAAEIQRALQNDKLPQNRKAFWQSVIDNFKAIDVTNGPRVGNDNLIDGLDLANAGYVS